jgi:UDP-N-acetylglucosamine/UDP-N-acetylgalactosamine diphosphorylase
VIQSDSLARARRLMAQAAGVALPGDAAPPVTFVDQGTVSQAVRRAGLDLIRSGRVAVVMMAGGEATRLESTALRGDMPIGPVSDRTIFRLQGEKVAALRQRYAPAMPFLVVTSAAVHAEVVASFEREHYFGVAPADVWFFPQPSLPVLDPDLNPVLLDGQIVESPTGHGGLLDALDAGSALRQLRQRGVTDLFYFQHPNVLEQVCDAALLGMHTTGDHEITTKAISDYQPNEALGRVVSAAGRLQIAEYRFVPVDAAPWWHALPANTGTHVWSLNFLERCLQDVRLPYYKLPYRSARIARPDVHKLEQFIFDLMPYASRSALFVVRRAEHYAVVKEPAGPNSLQAARQALTRLYQQWLDAAGAIPDTTAAQVEISPRFAVDGDDVKQKLPRGLRYPDRWILNGDADVVMIQGRD